MSTLTLVCSTIPELKIKNLNDSRNKSADSEELEEFMDHPLFENIEKICMAWFTIEYIVRLFSSPNKLTFLKSPLNTIDLISILPFYLSMSLNSFSTNLSNQTTSIRRLFTLFRVLRIFRIFKLARHSQGLKAFGKTMQKSSHEFSILLMFISITILLFSSLVYFAEKDEIDTQFTSIPASFW